MLKAIRDQRDALNFHVVSDYVHAHGGVRISPQVVEERLHGILGEVINHLPLTATHQQIEAMRSAIREGLIPAAREHAEKSGQSFDELEAELLKAISPTSRGGGATSAVE
jgi:hypothetical protein